MVKTIAYKEERKLSKMGEGFGLYLPRAVLNFLGIENREDDVEIVLSCEEGKHGKYVAIWVKND